MADYSPLLEYLPMIVNMLKATLLGLVVLLVAVFEYGCKFASLRAAFSGVLRSIHAIGRAQNLLLGALTEQGTLTAEQVKTVMDCFAGLATGNVQAMLRQVKATGNPMTEDELQRLAALVETIEDEESLTLADATELFTLAKKLQHDRPDEEAWVRLVNVAAYYVGLADNDAEEPETSSG